MPRWFRSLRRGIRELYQCPLLGIVLVNWLINTTVFLAGHWMGKPCLTLTTAIWDIASFGPILGAAYFVLLVAIVWIDKRSPLK